MTEEPISSPEAGGATAVDAYAARLQRLDNSRWRRMLNVQAPYRWNIRRMQLGHTLDIGTGLGRNLAHLGGNGVGVDHNPQSIAIARTRGLTAFTADDFKKSEYAKPESFDSLLVAHVLEHMSTEFGVSLLKEYLPFLRPGGTVCLITPQERGFTTDATHVNFVDFAKLSDVARQVGLREKRRYSFPFPRFAGKAFPYNEFILLATK